MSLVPLGSVSLGVAIPGGAACAIAGELGINLALPDIQARLAAFASFSPSLGDFTLDLAVAGQIIASINAALAVGLTPPSLGLQLAIIAQLILDLENAVLSINAQLTIVLGFISLLANAGVDLYAWDGANNDLGPALAAERGPGTGHTNALVLVTSNGATWSAMQQVFKTS